MPSSTTFKYETKRKNLYLRVARGHFATVNCHSNYYIDVIAQKTRMSEANAVAEELRSYFYQNTIVDTILCLDGTEVIGACLADQLSKAEFVNLNAHKSMYVVSPEFASGGQLIFRDNIIPMIRGKNVLVLGVSVSSGKTVRGALNAVRYYGGIVSGIAAIFSTEEEIDGIKVHSAFDPNDLPDYGNYPANNCPLCKAGVKLDALINSHGFSKL